MVRRSRPIRAGEEYFTLKEILVKQTGAKMSDPDFTGSLSKFVIEEDLVPLMVRRARQRKKQKNRGWFS